MGENLHPCMEIEQTHTQTYTILSSAFVLSFILYTISSPTDNVFEERFNYLLSLLHMPALTKSFAVRVQTCRHALSII